MGIRNRQQAVHYTLRDIVDELGGQLLGDETIVITRVASLSQAVAGQIGFLTDRKYLTQLRETAASAVILSPVNQELTDLPRIVTDNPYAYFAKLSALLNPVFIPAPGVATTASVDSSAVVPDSCSLAPGCVIEAGVVLGERVSIGPNSVVGRNTRIGNDSTLAANVTVYHDCTIGEHCNLFSGAVVGADGFGYAPEHGQWTKIPQVGRVLIADHVDIGANTTIDRGALDDTIIEQGVKIDNLVQIGHNCRIGAHTVIAGCVGIAGSAVIGQHCRIGGAAMVLGHLQVADHVTISPGTMITRSLLQADTYTALMPFQAHRQWLKTAANIRHLGDLDAEVRQLKHELAALKLALGPTTDQH
ncbi:UDP-3-O-(3-hydroxymyristoyl)glucosamine N-acyltransferase [Pseudomethylobacillus aquaticus]|uniref:UDP-3-O-(3-hydroxymyristoyl)glucosamine N-acyltransferase n=1 Tax=Pseudomethylobacillus aquaticus TaxID=2676064 RepID=UPI001EFFC278|nr:UDP-3-O-(3-hydroxymyristoyl)glucosamine N-acyltransferase [Pseudomethylobacillus aquaticus]